MTIALYPGTFDPIHYGHIDVARRAAQLFEHVYVGVYDRPNKNVLFSVPERANMASAALASIPNITVTSYSGLTVDYCQKINAQVIVRGLRVISDFELEYQMALTNRQLAPGIDMVCLMTSMEHAFLSSTLLKDLAMGSRSMSDFVPEDIEKRLRAKIVTGKG